MFRTLLAMVVLVVVLTAFTAEAAPVVSLWDFEGAPGNFSGYFSGPVADKVGTNDSTKQALSKEWAGAYEGGMYGRNGGTWPTDGMVVPTAGMSTVEGSVSWAWRDFTGSFNIWCDMMTLPLTNDGVNGIRWENAGGTTFTMYAGPSNGGGSLDIGWAHPTIGSAMDGNWHVFEITWKDGETIKVYRDGLLRWATTGIYNAVDYTLMPSMVVGNRTATSLSAIQGDYDYVVVTSVPEPVTMCLLGLGGVALLRRKR